MRDQSHMSERERAEHAELDAKARTYVEGFADKECWCVVADALAMVGKMKAAIRSATGEDIDLSAISGMVIADGATVEGAALTRAFDRAAGRSPKKPTPPVS